MQLNLFFQEIGFLIIPDYNEKGGTNVAPQKNLFEKQKNRTPEHPEQNTLHLSIFPKGSPKAPC